MWLTISRISKICNSSCGETVCNLMGRNWRDEERTRKSREEVEEIFQLKSETTERLGEIKGREGNRQETVKIEGRSLFFTQVTHCHRNPVLLEGR